LLCEEHRQGGILRADDLGESCRRVLPSCLWRFRKTLLIPALIVSLNGFMEELNGELDWHPGHQQRL
jgi:hypothetical protein